MGNMEVKTAAIRIRGARTHNLQGIDLDIPHRGLTVITGVSGSGKSSLAFDTLFAEGQRQYIDSLSPYSRQFVDTIPRPDLDSISGLQPTLCIDQRQGTVNPRSTLATVAEIYDYLRLMMARVGTPHCYQCGSAIIQQSPDEIIQALAIFPEGTRLVVMAPMVRDRKGAHRDVFEKIRAAGLVRVRVDGEMFEIDDVPELTVRKNHSIDAVCDRLIVRDGFEERLKAAVHLALQLTGGLVSSAASLPASSEQLVDVTTAKADKPRFQPSQSDERLFSTKYACATCGISYAELEPRIFSFNSPHGACRDCDGLGTVNEGNTKCPACKGARLRPESLAVTLQEQSIADITSQSLHEAHKWFRSLKLAPLAEKIAQPILAEMMHRIDFLCRVGVGYLTLDRPAQTLSGGELQRVRLATSIGSGLIGVCYVLDEPSIGLHPRDSDRLIESIHRLRDLGNTLVVVEHDEAMMLAADNLVDMGPGAGPNGGKILAAGSPSLVAKNPSSFTGQFLRKERRIEIPAERRVADKNRAICLRGAKLNNLREINVCFPLGCLIGVTGVSGSGKSSLVNHTLVPAIEAILGKKEFDSNDRFDSIAGVEAIDKIIPIDQKSLGRSSRSTPGTYTGAWDEIRKVFAQTRDAKQRGFSSNRFSFNAGAGRCETCGGHGQQKIEMNFLADIYVTCPQCSGRRFNRPTLTVRYKDANVADVLDMNIEKASEFFRNFTKIRRILESMCSVGLGYLQLGQASHTLSGGEAQRIKLATELARVSTGKTLYVLDEPTTGLHLADVSRLIDVLQNLVNMGNTVVVIEHHMDVAKVCDWIIDLGPEAGDAGGELVYQGPPEGIAGAIGSVTSRYLLGAVSG